MAEVRVGQSRPVLLAVGSLEQAPWLLQKAGRLQRRRVHVVRCVHDPLIDWPGMAASAREELKAFVLEAEAERLQERLDAVASDLELTAETVWSRKPWETVAAAAEAIDAELVVAGSARENGHGAAADDAMLTRASGVPVLLASGRPWRDAPVITACVDVYDEGHGALNRRVLEAAARCRGALGGRLHLVSVFPEASVWMSEGGVSLRYRHLVENIRGDIEDRVRRLCREHGIEDYELDTLEGRATDAILSAARRERSDLLVIGTKARKGLSGLLIGNTAERVILGTACDLMTVP